MAGNDLGEPVSVDRKPTAAGWVVPKRRAQSVTTENSEDWAELEG